MFSPLFGAKFLWILKLAELNLPQNVAWRKGMMNQNCFTLAFLQVNTRHLKWVDDYIDTNHDPCIHVFGRS